MAIEGDVMRQEEKGRVEVHRQPGVETASSLPAPGAALSWRCEGQGPTAALRQSGCLCPQDIQHPIARSKRPATPTAETQAREQKSGQAAEPWGR